MWYGCIPGAKSLIWMLCRGWGRRSGGSRHPYGIYIGSGHLILKKVNIEKQLWGVGIQIKELVPAIHSNQCYGTGQPSKKGFDPGHPSKSTVWPSASIKIKSRPRSSIHISELASGINTALHATVFQFFGVIFYGMIPSYMGASLMPVAAVPSRARLPTPSPVPTSTRHCTYDYFISQIALICKTQTGDKEIRKRLCFCFRYWNFIVAGGKEINII